MLRVIPVGVHNGLRRLLRRYLDGSTIIRRRFATTAKEDAQADECEGRGGDADADAGFCAGGEARGRFGA